MCDDVVAYNRSVRRRLACIRACCQSASCAPSRREMLMGYWGYDIWDGDGPLDYLISLVRTLSAEVDALLATRAEGRADLDADVLPRLAVIDQLCANLPAAPPGLDTVRC